MPSALVMKAEALGRECGPWLDGHELAAAVGLGFPTMGEPGEIERKLPPYLRAVERLHAAYSRQREQTLGDA